MELNYTKSGKYKVMISFEDGPVFVYNRFDTLEEAEYIIDSYSDHDNMVKYYVNKDAEFYLEIN